MDTQEYELLFSDLTMQEVDGQFDEVKRLMEADFPHSNKWMLRTQLTLQTFAGVAEMELNFYSNKDVYVIEYMPSQKDIFYNTDLSALTYWTQLAGWAVPKPHPELVQRKIDFWKHFWELSVIDSEYLDKLYGKRDNVPEST